MSELVHLRIDGKTRIAMQRVVATEHFASESEFIRDAIRKNLELYEKLKALQGSVKKGNYKQLPASEDLFRRLGLENVPEVTRVSRDDTISARAHRQSNVERVRKVRR